MKAKILNWIRWNKGIVALLILAVVLAVSGYVRGRQSVECPPAGGVFQPWK